uniref:Glycosyltransferase 2-like domain-containing protein n=1 Tax=viral metagenome TaxID=1070528 RepID=A0A6C0E333_9ZZZZ
MNTLRCSKEHIFNIKKKVQEPSDGSMYSHYSINHFTIDEKSVSIVMTSSNRTKQLYFTLKTIANSKFKNIQVIIVDDSDTDPVTIADLDNLHLPFCIDFIKIKRERKNWHNPLVSYNIGFKFIRGGKVVIQNAEVCHVGDVLQFIHENVTNDKYYTFDVKASLNYDTNAQLYKKNTNDISIYKEKELFFMWYQADHNIRNLHFLTALTKYTFDKVKEFSYDYTMGSWYDDNDFVLKIKSNGVTIVNIFYYKHNIGGIHLYHGMASDTWDVNVEENSGLFEKKRSLYESVGIYLDLTKTIEDFETKYNMLLMS